MKKLIFTGILILSFIFPAAAQNEITITEEDYNNYEVEMADDFRKEGKIYVVVAITGIILAGLLGYIIYIDRKVNKLEKMIEKENGEGNGKP